MSRWPKTPGGRYTHQSFMNIRPDELEPDDVIALKVIAVASYDNDWAAYMGPTDWDDEEVITGGDKLNITAARALFPQFALRAWRY